MVFKIDTSEFMNDEEVNQALSEMEQDAFLNTDPILTRSAEDSVERISFREKHTTYLKTHPKINPQDYLANVKTMIRIRA